jgi:hypothetical protein
MNEVSEGGLFSSLAGSRKLLSGDKDDTDERTESSFGTTSSGYGSSNSSGGGNYTSLSGSSKKFIFTGRALGGSGKAFGKSIRNKLFSGKYMLQDDAGHNNVPYGLIQDTLPVDTSDLKSFLVSPIQRSCGIVQCYIRRDRSGTNKLFPVYSLYLGVSSGSVSLFQFVIYYGFARDLPFLA